jgi:6-phosphogluconolactonase (cycloisomerase 2 family)
MVVAAVGAAVLPAIAFAQKVPVGPEFQVNTYTTGYQGAFKGPSVAADAAGNFVVVWQREAYAGTVARRYSSGGTPLGPEFVVNGDGSYPYPEYQEAGKPSVASDPAGNFVVVWESYDCEGYSGVCARQFDSSGTALGPQFKVDGLSSDGFNPKVAADATGNFVVVWGEYQYTWPVFARRFDAGGMPLGAQFQVNTYTTGCCGYSIIDEDFDSVEVAADAAGRFMVIWTRESPATTGVFGRVFDDDGAPVGGEFQVNTTPIDDYITVGIDADGMGRFVTAWQSSDEIRGRRFNGTGTALGAEFQVSSTSSYANFGPKVAADAAGNFVVVWSGPDPSDGGVRGQQFDSAENPLGGEFQVNTFTAGYQRLASVASGASGDFVVTWQSYYQDGDGDGIFGQRFGGGGPPAPLACSPTPRTNCRQTTSVRKGTLLLKDGTPDANDVLTWKWQRGSATELADYGDPTIEGGTDYVLCVYDGSAEPQPRLRARAPAGGQCPGRPCWTQFGEKYIEYKDKGLDPDGLRLVRLQRGDEGKTKITVRGKREHLDMPALPLSTPVVAQLQAENGECWENRYSDFILRNVTTQFKAKPNGPTTITTTTTTTVITTTTAMSTTTTLPGVCGDNQVNQLAEECDGTDDDVCTGVCSPGCFCTCGVRFALGAEVSPDGDHVYVPASDGGGTPSGSVATFARNATTGELQFVEVHFDDVGGVDGLLGASSTALSPDGAHVYATGSIDDAVTVFSRDLGTGALTFVEAKFDGTGGIDGLDASASVALSPDGAHVYVTGAEDDAVAVFGRDGGTGALTFVEGEFDGVGGVDGLNGAGAVAVSPDGAHVYVGGSALLLTGEDAVAVFSRNAGTGALTFVEALFDGVGGVDGLNGAGTIAISPDGAHVYVAGEFDNAVAVFSRNAGSGALTFGGVAVVQLPIGVRVSPDGAHVYATGLFGSLAAFSRNALTGALTLVETESVGASAVSVSTSADGAHVYAANFLGAIATFSRDAGTGALTFVEATIDGPECAASPSGAFLELRGDLFD